MFPLLISVVVINVWLCCLTGYVVRRRKNNVLIMEVQKSIVAVRPQDVLKRLWRLRSLADRSGTVLGVVCGLRKEYPTLGKWLKA